MIQIINLTIIREIIQLFKHSILVLEGLSIEVNP
jgi:hypothetical protein